jgi:hypothetical protein
MIDSGKEVKNDLKDGIEWNIGILLYYDYPTTMGYIPGIRETLILTLSSLETSNED